MLTRRDFLKLSGLGALAWSTGCSLGGKPSDPDETAVDFFSLAVLPDTQHYADKHPQIYEAQTRWIAEHALEERIAFVTHLGDIVNNGPNLRQWQNARQAMDLLDQAGLPYGTCVGNHDVKYPDAEYGFPSGTDQTCSDYDGPTDCNARAYLDHFAPTRYAGKPWFVGASPSGQSNAQAIEACGLKWLFLHLALDFRPAEREWAQSMIDAHPDALVHVSTHRYLYDFRGTPTMPGILTRLDGRRFDTVACTFFQDLFYDDGLNAEDFFQTFVAVNPRIFMVHCGHIDAEFKQQSVNQAGLPVHELLTDFQTMSPNGGDGWMKLLKIIPERNRIEVRTYSPHLGRFRQNGDGFEASLEVLSIGLEQFGDKLTGVVDVEAFAAQVDRWTNTPEGRKEYYDLLYAEGKRDSAFTLEVDFGAYLANT